MLDLAKFVFFHLLLEKENQVRLYKEYIILFLFCLFKNLGINCNISNNVEVWFDIILFKFSHLQDLLSLRLKLLYNKVFNKCLLPSQTDAIHTDVFQAVAHTF